MRVFILTALLFLTLGVTGAHAQGRFGTEETLEAQVTEVISSEERFNDGVAERRQTLELLVNKGSLSGRSIIVESGGVTTATPEYKVGDKVLVLYIEGVGDDTFYIIDFIRHESLMGLLIVFVIIAIVIGKRAGLTSFIGLAASFAVIFYLILPLIQQGMQPIPVAILGSMIIVPLTFYLSHGIGKKTHIAVAATIATLIITGLIAVIVVNWAHLTGFSSEEASFLHIEQAGIINMRGLLLAGIIIGVLGILDDVTVSQSSIVSELYAANPKFGKAKLYKSAMNVGRDHIASLINTLVLVYTGASLPLLLLFMNSPRPVGEVINYEIVADEIVRTLVGSIGLILAVPITTLLAVTVYTRNSKGVKNS